MGTLSEDLRNMGYEPTDRESPFDESGSLWTKGYELVCDETGIVISNDDGGSSFRGERQTTEEVYRYQNSDNVKLPGGYIGSYDWGHDGERFKY